MGSTTASTTGNSAPPHATLQTQQAALQNEMIHRAAWKAGMLGAINVLSRVLAARFIVLVAIVGGIMLALPTLSQPDWFKVGILGVYCLGVVMPAVFLAAWGK